MTKFGKLVLGLMLLVVVGIGLYFAQRQTPVAVAPVVIPPAEVPIVEEPVVTPSETTYPDREMSGRVSDLVSFSIKPNTKVHGILSYRGSIKGAYFFEGNILINILDSNKKLLKASNAVAKTDWMTVGPVDFEGNIDFTSLPTGPAYFEIHNDNASGLPENDKSILIPIVIDNPSSISSKSDLYSGWRAYDADEIHFMYPLDWKITDPSFYYDLGEGYRFSIFSPRREEIGFEQAVPRKEVYESGSYDVRRVQTYYFYISKKASQSAKAVFDKLVSSVKYQSAD